MRVYAARYGSNKIIAEWPSLEEWLYSEHQTYLDKLQNGDYQLVDVVEGSLTDITFNVDWVTAQLIGGYFMSAIFLSTESQSPAAQMIIDCFIEIQQNMDIVSLDKYTDAISTISIIPFCVDEEFKNTFPWCYAGNQL